MIAEPTNISVQVLNLTAVSLCWRKPHYGRVKKYEIKFGPVGRPNEEDRRMVRRLPQEIRQCLSLSGLESFEEYWLEMRAWAGNLPGASTRLHFSMDADSE